MFDPFYLQSSYSLSRDKIKPTIARATATRLSLSPWDGPAPDGSEGDVDVGEGGALNAEEASRVFE